MERNQGSVRFPGEALDDVVAAMFARMTHRHALPVPVVVDVVNHAIAELVGTTGDPDRLRRMLERRADARLLAMARTSVVIACNSA